MTTSTSNKALDIATETAKTCKDMKALKTALSQNPDFTSEFNGGGKALSKLCRQAMKAAKPAKAPKAAKPAKEPKAPKEPTTRGMTIEVAKGGDNFRGLDRLLFQLDKGGPATAGALSRGLELSNTFVNKTVGRPDSRGQQLKYVACDGQTGMLSITEAGRTYYTTPKPAKATKVKREKLAAPAKTVKGAKRPGKK